MRHTLLFFFLVFAAKAHAQIVASDDPSRAILGAGNSLLNGGISGLQSNLTNQGTALIASEVNKSGKSFLDQYFAYSEFSVGLGAPTKPTFGALVVAPLSSREDVTNTFFNQTSIFSNDGRTTINLGLGYRRLAADNKALLGINVFYDQEFPYNHQRTSIGVEARTTAIELNANRYLGVSDWRTVRDGGEERALGGYDIELGMALPYTPWAKVYGRKFTWYALDGVDNLRGADITFRAQVPILPGLAIEAGHREYQSYTGTNFVRVSYNLLASTKSRSQQIFTETAWTLKNMEEHRFDKVRRENLIVKQSRAKSGVSFKGYNSL